MVLTTPGFNGWTITVCPRFDLRESFHPRQLSKNRSGKISLQEACLDHFHHRGIGWCRLSRITLDTVLVS